MINTYNPEPDRSSEQPPEAKAKKMQYAGQYVRLDKGRINALECKLQALN